MQGPGHFHFQGGTMRSINVIKRAAIGFGALILVAVQGCAGSGEAAQEAAMQEATGSLFEQIPDDGTSEETEEQ